MIRAAVSLLLIPLMTGCAAIAHGRTQRIKAASEPAGAEVSLLCNGNVVGEAITPAVLTLSRREKGCELRFARDGFREERAPLVRRINGTYWVNAVVAATVIPAVAIAGAGGIGSGAVAGILSGVSAAGFVGLIHDRVTGSMYRQSPDAVSVRLQPADKH